MRRLLVLASAVVAMALAAAAPAPAVIPAAASYRAAITGGV